MLENLAKLPVVELLLEVLETTIAADVVVDDVKAALAAVVELEVTFVVVEAVVVDVGSALHTRANMAIPAVNKLNFSISV